MSMSLSLNISKSLKERKGKQTDKTSGFSFIVYIYVCLSTYPTRTDDEMRLLFILFVFFLILVCFFRYLEIERGE